MAKRGAKPAEVKFSLKFLPTNSQAKTNGGKIWPRNNSELSKSWLEFKKQQEPFGPKCDMLGNDALKF